MKYSSTTATGDSTRFGAERGAGYTPGSTHSILPPHRSWGGKPFQILLVIADTPEREAMARVLRNYGLTARGFTDPLRAREWFLEHRESVIAVIADRALPLIGGEKLVELLEQLKPSIPVALLSDTVQPELVDRFLDKESRSVFKKPVDYGVLIPWLFQKLPTPLFERQLPL